MATADAGDAQVLDASSWRGAGLVGLLVLGLLAVRLVPVRSSRSPARA